MSVNHGRAAAARDAGGVKMVEATSCYQPAIAQGEYRRPERVVALCSQGRTAGQSLR